MISWNHARARTHTHTEPRGKKPGVSIHQEESGGHDSPWAPPRLGGCGDTLGQSPGAGERPQGAHLRGRGAPAAQTPRGPDHFEGRTWAGFPRKSPERGCPVSQQPAPGPPICCFTQRLGQPSADQEARRPLKWSVFLGVARMFLGDRLSQIRPLALTRPPPRPAGQPPRCSLTRRNVHRARRGFRGVAIVPELIYGPAATAPPGSVCPEERPPSHTMPHSSRPHCRTNGGDSAATRLLSPTTPGPG